MYVRLRGLDLSKEVLLLSVCQMAAKLCAVKVGGLKKNLPLGQSRTTRGTPRRQNHFQSLTDHNFAALVPTAIHNTSMERSIPRQFT